MIVRPDNQTKNTWTSDKSTSDSTFKMYAIWSKRVNLLLTLILNFFYFSKYRKIFCKTWIIGNMSQRWCIKILMSCSKLRQPCWLIIFSLDIVSWILNESLFICLFICHKKRKTTSIFSATREISRSAKLAKTWGDKDVLWFRSEQENFVIIIFRTWG